MSFRRVAAALLLAASCSGEGDGAADAGMDASAMDTSVVSTVEIGTGREAFEALAAGEMVPLIQGAQGGGRVMGYHIWSAARVKGMNPEDALVEVVLRDAGGGEQARQARMITLQPDGEWHVVYGFAPRIQDCCALASKTVIMEVRAEDSSGKVASDDIMVMAGPCIDGNTGADQCP